jgi:cellobiose PTS system EIIB component
VRNVLIVCGAGASSTFLAHRLRAGARARGLEAVFRAEALSELPASMPGADAVLVGPHLDGRFDELRREAERVGTPISLLPPDVFGAGGAELALDTVVLLLAADGRAESPPGVG